LSVCASWNWGPKPKQRGAEAQVQMLTGKARVDEKIGETHIERCECEFGLAGYVVVESKGYMAVEC
jgi:hypothetical protein